MKRPLAVLLIAASLMPALAGAETHLRLNELAGPDSPEAVALKQFKRMIEKNTRGDVRIDLNFNGTLGNPSDSLEKMISGELDLFACDFEIFLPLLVDEVGGLELPFMVPGNEVAARYMETPYFDEGKARDLHLRHIRFLELDAYRAPSRTIASVVPLTSLEAFKGLRLAVFPAPTKPDMKVWQGLGATLVEVEKSDLAAAFGRHELDAVIMGSPAELIAAKVTRLAPHVGPIQDRPQLWQISIHEGAWQKLTPVQQSVFLQAAAVAAADYRRDQDKRFQAGAASLKDFGKDIHIDALAAHRALAAVYARQVKVGGTAPKVLESAELALGGAK